MSQTIRNVNVTISYDTPDPLQQIASAKITYRTITDGLPQPFFQEVVLPTDASNSVVLNLIDTTADEVQIQLALCNAAGCSVSTSIITRPLALAAPAATTPTGVVVTNAVA